MKLFLSYARENAKNPQSLIALAGAYPAAGSLFAKPRKPVDFQDIVNAYQEHESS